MHTILPLSIAVLVAVGVLGIGIAYLVSPAAIVGSFGLKLPALDPDTRAWLRLKGVRDSGCGLLVLMLMLCAERRTLGAALLVLALIPFGDMCVVLSSGGSKQKALSIHGLTCVVLLIAGLLFTHIL
ncbi:DUF4267 domain-containing protein [Acidipila sp. EB88]|uniref:DUF4267 domain-containing protein n=1 Tax=Acidipila sp. EB88 TaxID=2305226 RepID=UPI000F5ED522|nr:DUF4267 domain-containing protein [Acidipila sp. EB88]RRA47420.1 DUF4267 domain-containing protein [Acidipila sp. EB88]